MQQTQQLNAHVSKENNTTQQFQSLFSAIDYLNQNKLTTTEKGAVAHRKDGLVKEKQVDSKEISGPMVALWNKAILGQDRILLHQNIQDVANEIQELEKYDQYVQAKKLKVMLITMWAETRDCRGKTGGKGWRDGAHWMFLRLSREFPETMMSLFHLYPKYGSWKDLTRLIVIISEDIKNGVVPTNCEIYNRITDEIYNMWSEQLLIDSQNLTKHQNSNKDTKCELSLCAKYIPKEKKSVDKVLKVTKKLAIKMFPKLAKKSIGSALKKLRQLYSPINKAIKTTEVFMAACKFSEIDFKFVPGRCLNKHRKGFLNELRGISNKGKERSSEQDRRDCRTHFVQHIEKAKSGAIRLKGKQMFAHELVANARKIFNGSSSEKDVINEQWRDIRDSLIELLREEAQQRVLTTLEGISLYDRIQATNNESIQTQLQARLNELVDKDLQTNSTVMLSDVSGSMDCDNGIPMNASIALGIMNAEIMHELQPTFGDRFISFNDTPEWITLDPTLTFCEKVNKAINSPWGGTTDFLAAFEMILKAGIMAKLTSEQMPKRLIIASDMQFDSACGNFGRNDYRVFKSLGGKVGKFFQTDYSSKLLDYATTHQMITEAYEQAGIQACGEPWKVPEIVYWNLRGNTLSFPVQANTPGAIMLSGFNMNAMTLLMRGNDPQSVDPSDTRNTWKLLTETLEDERYDEVRKIIESSNEL